MRTIIFSKKEGNYLHKNAEENSFALGIIIGQKTDEKYYVIHLAKLSEDEESPVHHSQDAESPFDNIDAQALADQWISATKMAPGSFSVLGIFIATKKIDMNDEKHAKNIKKLLGTLQSLITNNNSVCEYSKNIKEEETLFLCYSSTTLNANGKVYSNSSSGGILTPIDCKAVEKLPQWYLFQSNYDLDDVFPITDNKGTVNIENQFSVILQAVRLNIYSSEIFVQYENVDDSVTLENYIKDKNKKNDVPVFHASILLTANMANDLMIKIRTFSGTIRFSGIVSSRVWCHAKSTFKEIKESIRTDILRSLAARIQIYCDGLTDLHSNNGGVVVSEPPRRIYFCFSKSQGIQFSEYIFRGETPSVAVAQAKQILDMDINSECIFDDLEGLPDEESVSFSEDAIVSSQKKNPGPEISRAMYMLGISVALLVLLISVLLHYIFL